MTFISILFFFIFFVVASVFHDRLRDVLVLLREIRDLLKLIAGSK